MILLVQQSTLCNGVDYETKKGKAGLTGWIRENAEFESRHGFAPGARWQDSHHRRPDRSEKGGHRARKESQRDSARAGGAPEGGERFQMHGRLECRPFQICSREGAFGRKDQERAVGRSEERRVGKECRSRWS